MASGPSRTPRRCCARSTATPWPTASRWRSTRTSRTTAAPRAAAGCTAASTRRTATTSPARASRTGPDGTGQPSRLGVRLAVQPPHAVQPRLGRPGGQAVVGAQEDGLVGRGRRHVDRHRRAGLPARPPPGLPPGLEQASARHGRPWRRAAVHHGGGRLLPAVRADRPEGRSAAHALRAGGKPGAQRRVRPAAQPDRQDLAAARQRAARRRRPALPLRVHHLPPDRAALRRRDRPGDAAHRRAAAGGVRGDRARARQRTRHRQLWTGPCCRPCAARSRCGRW